MSPTPYRLAWLTVVAAGLTAGCSEPVQEAALGSVEFSVDSTGRFPVARIAGEPPVWSIDMIGTVGSVGLGAEPAPDEFGRVTSVTSGPNETVWIADQYANRIKVFGSDGALQLEIGREGRGPGEFSALYSLAWVGDILLAMDLGNGRIAEISPDGTWLGSRAAPGRVSGSPALLRFYPVSDTVVLQWSLENVDREARRVWVQQGPGGVVGTWPQPTSDPPEPTTVVCDRPDGSVSFFSIPFSGQVLQHPLPDGSRYEAWSDEYRFALIDAHGDTLQVVERSWPTIPISDEEWQAATAEFRTFRSESPDARCTPRTMARPDTRAPIRNLLLDTQGRVWVEAVQEAGTTWEIFDPGGRLLASVDGFEYSGSVAPSIRGDHIAWVRTDSLDVQYVEWGRLNASSF